MENAILNAYYADFNDRENAAREAERRASRDAVLQQDRDYLIGNIETAYDEAKAGNGVNVQVALAAIAAFFYTPSGNADADGNAYNDTLFQQRGMLGNLCNNAKWMVENCDRQLTELYTKLDEQEATMDGSEIALRNLEQTVSKVERMQQAQIPAAEEWFELTKAAYEAVVGEAWKPFVKTGKSAKEQTEDAVKARLAALRARR